ncbi:MAG: PDZ domain-containing protein [Planctomycetota bacterium]
MSSSGFRNFSILVFLLVCGAASQLVAQRSGERQPRGALPDNAVRSFQWRSIGPANMGGRITSLAVYEEDSNRWWAATASGGLLKTTNNGITFEHQFDQEATVSIGDVQVSQSNPDILWVGTGESNPRNSSSWGDGVYKSTDGGATWTNMGLKKIFQTGRIAIHPTNPDIVYVGALGRLWGPNKERGLYKTSDGGKSWKKILYIDDKTGIVDVQMNPKDPETLLVAAYERKRDGFDGNDPEVKYGEGAGIYRTTDGGKNFAKVTKGLPSGKIGRIGLTIYRKNPRWVYAVVESDKIGQTPKDFPYVGFNAEDADVGAKILQVSRNTAASKAGLKTGDIVIQADGGRILSFQDLQKAIRSKKSGDKSQWEVRRDGENIMLELTYGSRPNQGGSRTRGGGNSSLFGTRLGGQIPNVQGQQGKDDGEYGGVYQSKDGGESWKRINSVNPRPMYYSQIRVDPSDSKYLYVLGTSLYKSKDGGAEFTDDGASGEVHVDHHALWVDPNDGRHMILGNDGGIYVTYDRMENWDHHNHVAIGQFYHVGLSSDEDYNAYGGLQDNGSWGGPTRVRDTSGPMNSDWFRVGGGDGFVCLVDPNDPNLIYFESQNGAMGRINLETGARGSIRPRPPRGTQYKFNWKTPFILSPHNASIHYSAGNHVFKSVSKGDRTQVISPKFTLTDDGAGSAITESPRVAGVVYAGSTDGALWMTRDDGETWYNLRDAESIAKAPESQSANAATGRGPSEGRGAAGGFGRGQGRQGGPGGRPGGRPGGGRSGGGRGPGGMSPERMMQFLGRFDSDNDGVIKLDDLPQQMRPMVSRYDTDSDGFLTQDEMPGASTEEQAEGKAEEKPSRPKTSQETENDPAESEKPRDTSGREANQNPSDEPASDEKIDVASKDEKQEQKEDGTGSDEDGTGRDEEGTEQAADQDDMPVKQESEEAGESKEESDEETAADKPAEDKVSGTYKGQFTGNQVPPDSGLTFVLRLQPDNKLKGSYETSRSEGEIEDGEYDPKTGDISFAAESQQASLEFKANLSDGSLTGVIEINGSSFSINFEAERVGDATGTDETEEEVEDTTQPLYELVPDPRWVSSLTASRFSDSRCYVTFDGHRSNDDEPYLLVTENFGKSWKSIRSNLPSSAGSTRVLREDIENPDVLYLGCEFSIWVSIDRGESWTKLNSNLPTVAVHEIAQHPTRGEIVAGTHGRSLWVLDVTGLRQLSKESLTDEATLYKPNTVIRWRSMASRGSSGTRQFVGENPDADAKIYYSLGRNARSARMIISTLIGDELLRRDVSVGAGLHVESWDLRGSAGGRGRGVGTGEYLVTLEVDGQEQKQVLRVVADPEYPESSTAEDESEFWDAFFGFGSEEESGFDRSSIDF